MGLPDNWDELRSTVIRLYDNYCLRCDIQYAKKDLTVHHMIPRDEGGSNDITNLVPLCPDCHDFVEIEGLKTKADIQGSYEDEIPKQKELKHSGKKENFVRPSWHAHVYGGDRNPLL